MLFDQHLYVADAGQFVERSQLQVVGGKQRAAADCAVEMFDNCLGDCETVIGAGATADLVEDHKAPLRGAI